MNEAATEPKHKRRWYVRHLLIPFLLIPVCSCTAPGRNPAESKPTQANETETSYSAEKQLFVGRWSLVYAAFATTASTFYTFDVETVTVNVGVSESADGIKRSDLPITWHATRYKYSIDPSTSPKTLTMTPLAKGSDKERWLYEFRDGGLWMCPDVENMPRSAKRLKPGSGGDGWLIGLSRVDTANQSTAN